MIVTLVCPKEKAALLLRVGQFSLGSRASYCDQSCPLMHRNGALGTCAARRAQDGHDANRSREPHSRLLRDIPFGATVILDSHLNLVACDAIAVLGLPAIDGDDGRGAVFLA